MAKVHAKRSSSNPALERAIFTLRQKTKRNMPEKMLIKKFDPVARKHVDYKETKLK